MGAVTVPVPPPEGADFLRAFLFAAVMLAASAGSAFAQSRPELSIDLMTDERRRGISWSDGDPAAAASLYWAPAGPFWTEVAAVTLRGSARHGGADAVVDWSGGLQHDIGPWRLGARGAVHIFPGRSGLAYGELGGSAGFTLGPALVEALALYAPPQDAIGGDNLYLRGGISVGIPATPVTLSAGIGRSSGSVDDPVKAARLRPAGSYTDYQLGIEYRQARWSAGLTFTDTDEREMRPSPYADPGNAGSRLTGRVRFSF
jgi:hypothetical protein